MGSIICHNMRTKQKRISFVENTEASTCNEQPPPHLDLPYRHYISKNFYIASALPHTLNQFPDKKRVKISKGIESSSIMIRRISKESRESFLGSKTIELTNP